MAGIPNSDLRRRDLQGRRRFVVDGRGRIYAEGLETFAVTHEPPRCRRQPPRATGFRAFDKDAYRREDDLFDAEMYAALVSLGDGTEARWSRIKGAA